MNTKTTAPQLIQLKKAGKKIVCCTGYDALDARLISSAGIDVLLVGDSVANARLGFENTLPMSVEQMAYHVSAVTRVPTSCLVVADLPFGSYQSSVEQAVDSAVVLIKAGAHAVKLEGPYLEAVEAIVQAGIPVMGHLGMTPQSVNVFGGHKVQGRDEAQKEAITDAALSIESAGAFAVVLELIPRVLAKEVSERLTIPTIGIGAGPDCDGEIQVITDILGFSERVYKHTTPFLDGRTLVTDALRTYAEAVRKGEFPTESNSN